MNLQQENIKVVFLGRSKKFISSFEQILKKISFIVIPWRDCGSADINDLVVYNQNPDLIVICGYDYGGGKQSYRNFIEANVSNPLNLIDKLVGSKTNIIYVDTEDSIKTFTYSRYRFAKNCLAVNLIKHGKRYKRAALPVLIDNSGFANIYGDRVTKIIFNFLIKLNLVKTINPKQLIYLVKQSLNSELVPNPIALKGKYLHIKRPVFIDRILRFICG